MRPTYRRLTQATIVVGTLLLTTLATAAPISGKGSPSLTVRNVVVSGDEVTITVVNRTGRAQMATVTSRVLTRNGEFLLATPVTAVAGETVTIRVTAPEPALDDLPLGVVVDDGVPF
jgi:hypothetical protein